MDTEITPIIFMTIHYILVMISNDCSSKKDFILSKITKTYLPLITAALCIATLAVLIPVKMAFFDNGNMIEHDGVPNFYRVSETVFRSGQPSRQGFEEISSMGIRTIINLRSLHSDTSLIENLDFNYYSIPMTLFEPTEAQKQTFLEIVTDSTKTPVLIHCYNGSDRTGSMVAYYRITQNGWSNDHALIEMTSGGYGYKWFLFGFKKWIRDVEPDKID